MPAILSGLIWPGLGQIAKGEILKGSLILLGFLFFLIMTLIFTELFSIQLGMGLSVGMLAIYLWNIYDAYRHVP